MLARVPLREFESFAHRAVETGRSYRQEIHRREHGGQQTEDLQLMPCTGVECQGRHTMLRQTASGAVTCNALHRSRDPCLVQAVDEVPDAIQFEAIEDLLAAPVARDHARFTQHIEMLRGGGPAEATGLDEIADAAFARDERAYQNQASRAAQRLEDGVRRGGTSFRRHAGNCISSYGEMMFAVSATSARMGTAFSHALWACRLILTRAQPGGTVVDYANSLNCGDKPRLAADRIEAGHQYTPGQVEPRAVR